MNKLLSLALVLILSLASTAALAEQAIVIGGEDETVTFGKLVSIPDVCDITFLDWTSGEYATSIPVSERADDEVIVVSRAIWNESSQNYRKASKFAKGYDSSSTLNGYIPQYATLGYALKSSTKEYKLIDVSIGVLNTQLQNMVFEESASANLSYLGKYTFSGSVYMETTDDMERVNEWLVAPTPIPMLVTRTMHFVFEAPNIVAESKDSLVLTISIAGQAYTLTLR